MIRARVVVTLLVAASPFVSEAQGLPFTVTIVDWSRESLERQRRAYRSESGDREILFCVESWTTSAVGAGLEQIVITSVRREESGGTNTIRDVGARCVARDGKPLPMFHTHSDGNCQLSPSDLITLVARAAPFEGVQCGERHFVWAFAWQVLAIATSVERERLARAGGRAP